MAKVFKQVKLTKRAALAFRRPKAQTRRAIGQARGRRNVEVFNSVSEWAEQVRSL